MIRRLLAGIGSLVALAALMVGAPLLLLTASRTILADGIPDVGRILLSRDNGTMLLVLAVAVAWLAWLYLAAAVLVEILVMSKRIRRPRLPALSVGRSIVAPLVTALVLLATVVRSPAAMASPIAGAAPQQGAIATQVHLGGTVTPRTQAPGEYTVVKGDNLSKLAARFLGDPNRWREIYEASTGIEQPGGRHLSNPNLILPGWTLQISSSGDEEVAVPAQAAVVVTPAAQQAPSPATHVDPVPAAASAAQAAAATTAPAAAATTAPVTQAASTADAPSAPAPAAEVAADDEVLPWRTIGGVGSLLAAGLIGVLATRRVMQHRSRPLGRRIAMPDQPDAQIEQELRTVADPPALTDVDQHLRKICAAAAGQPLPALRAVRVTEAQLEAYFADPPTIPLPSPWQATSDPTLWYAEARDLTVAGDSDEPTTTAPYPALVSLGHDAEHGLVLFDLEQIGSLAVTGDPALTREVLVALAMELALAPWADDLQVTLVGVYPELGEALGTGRIRWVPTIDHLLDTLESRAAADRAAFAAADLTDLSEARPAGLVPDAWTPEILLIDGPLTPRHRNVLAGLVQDMPRVAIAAVTTDADPLGQWQLAVDSAEEARLLPMGLDLVPQRVDGDAYHAILRLIDATEEPATSRPAAASPPPAVLNIVPQVTIVAPQPTGQPTKVASGKPQLTVVPHTPPDPPTEAELPAPPADEQAPDVAQEPLHAPVTAEQPHAGTPEPPASPAAPVLRILGPIQLTGATDQVESGKVKQLTEYLAYLLLHPGATREQIDDAVWPSRSTENNTQTRNTATSKLRRWLGVDPEGREWMPPHGGYTVRPEVTTDWQQFCQLLPEGAESATSAALEEALALVAGRPFEGADRRRYAWKEQLQQVMIAEITDAAIELGYRRLMEGRWADVEAATTIGITVSPGIERLWRLRILAAHQAGNDQAVSEAVDRLETLVDALGVSLDPETLDLLEGLDHHAPYPTLQEAIR